MHASGLNPGPDGMRSCGGTCGENSGIRGMSGKGKKRVAGVIPVSGS